jgi:hypothetical protein
MVARSFSLSDPPYTGALGSTRREVVFVPTPEGGARRVEIVRGVNAATDPALVRQAVEGSLHRHGDHDLAVPFVFHDPAARRFALVVPAGLAHQEISLRADLLTRLSVDTSEPIPAYVREARTVLGAAGLRRWLDEPDERAARDDLATREERVRRRAEDITRRESDALAREDALTTREDSVAQDELAMRANMSALGAREAKLRAREESMAEPDGAVAEAEASMMIDPELAVAPAASHATDESMELEPDELTGRLSVPRAEPAPESAEIEPEPDELAAEEVSPVDELVTAPPPEEPPLRLSPRSTTPWAAVVDGTVRLWCPGNAETAAVVSGDDVSARVQVDATGTQPLALLALLRGDAGATLARVVLDLRSPEDRGVLESLGRVFRVRVEVVSPGGRAIASHVLGAPCEPVAQRALEVLAARAPDAAALTAESAVLLREGVASAVDPRAAVPDDERDLSTAEGVTRALAAYAPLLDVDQVARTSLTTGVPVAQIEAAAKRLVLAALRVGAPLSRAYVERAIKVGVVPDEATLVTRGMQAYRRSVDAGIATIGRRRADASVAWGPLLDAARRLEVPVDATVRRGVGPRRRRVGSAARRPPPPRVDRRDGPRRAPRVDHPPRRALGRRALARGRRRARSHPGAAPRVSPPARLRLRAPRGRAAAPRRRARRPLGRAALVAPPRARRRRGDGGRHAAPAPRPHAARAARALPFRGGLAVDGLGDGRLRGRPGSGGAQPRRGAGRSPRVGPRPCRRAGRRARDRAGAAGRRSRLRAGVDAGARAARRRAALVAGAAGGSRGDRNRARRRAAAARHGRPLRSRGRASQSAVDMHPPGL